MRRLPCSTCELNLPAQSIDIENCQADKKAIVEQSIVRTYTAINTHTHSRTLQTIKYNLFLSALCVQAELLDRDCEFIINLGDKTLLCTTHKATQIVFVSSGARVIKAFKNCCHNSVPSTPFPSPSPRWVLAMFAKGNFSRVESSERGFRASINVCI